MPRSSPFHALPLPAFSDNYIWLLVPHPDAPPGTGVAVVDPGQSAPVIAHLSARGWHLSAILLTHHHADHVGGVADLLAYADAQGQVGRPPVFGPANENIAFVDHPLRDGETIETASPRAHFTVIDVPGHTLGHIAYFYAGADEKASIAAAAAAGASPDAAAAAKDLAAPRLFCGDTLFASGCGRLFEGTPAQMLASLDRLAALPDATRVHCAHEYTLSNIRFARAVEPGNVALQEWAERAAALRAAGQPTLPTTIAHERAVNPFLRAGLLPDGTPSSGDPAARLAAFTEMRAWKDRF